MKWFETLTLSWIKYIAQVLSFSIFAYIFAAHAFRLIKPTEEYIDQNLFNIEYLRFILFLGFFLAFIGWFVGIVEKKIKAVSPFRKNRKETFFYLLTAFFFAVFYNGIFAFAGILQYPIFLILIGAFFLFIPQLIVFYVSFNLVDFRPIVSQTSSLIQSMIRIGRIANQKTKLVSENAVTASEEINKKTIEVGLQIVTIGRRYIFFVIFILFSLSIVAFAFLFVSTLVKNYLAGETYKQNQNRKKFYINRVIPQKAMHAQRVKIEGYNLGWKMERDLRFQVMTTVGPINLIEEWTDERLEFTVPINLPEGRKMLWIERPSDDPNNPIVIKSNKVPVDILSRFVIYPRADDTVLQRAIKKIKRILFFSFPSLDTIILTTY